MSRVVDALNVRRNAKVGAVASLALTVFAYGFFVIVPSSTGGAGLSGYKPTFEPLYLVLAFVVLVSTAMLVTVGLTVRTVVRATMSPPKWIRRGGTVAIVGAGSLAAMATLAPLTGGSDLRTVFARVLPLAPFVLVFGVWAVHAAHRHRYGIHGTIGALLAGTGLFVLGWIGLVDPGGFVGIGLEDVDPRFFFAANVLALFGTSFLGSAVLRAGAVRTYASLALLFVLPAGLAGVTVLTYTSAESLAFLPFGVTLGVAWTAVGRELRQGNGIPPAESFDPGVDLDPSG